jgi:hypothetical protein
MMMPESGIIRGAVSEDGRVFIAVETEVADSYHMIYAIKKEAQTARDLNGKFMFCMYGTRLTTAKDQTDADYPQGNRLSYKVEIGFVDLDPLSNTGNGALTTSGIGNDAKVERPMSDTQNTFAPYLDPSSGTMVAKLSVATTGTWTLNTGDSNMQGFTLSDDSVSLLCGSTITNTEVYTYTAGADTITATTNAMQFGVVLAPITGTLLASEVTGSYTFVYRGDQVRQDSGITHTAFWVMLGRCSYDGAGNVTATMTRCERGVVSTEVFNGKYDVVTKNIGSGALTLAVKVVRMFDATATTEPEKEDGPKVILAQDKKVGIIYQSPTEGDGVTPNDERGLGFAVKTK